MSTPADLAQKELNERLARIERAIMAIAWWLTQTPDSFGKRDAEAVGAILRGERD